MSDPREQWLAECPKGHREMLDVRVLKSSGKVVKRTAIESAGMGGPKCKTCGERLTLVEEEQR